MTLKVKFHLKEFFLLLALINLLSGCSMGSNQKPSFQQEALEVLEVLEICIENFGFSESSRLELDEFFESKHNEEDKTIKKNIASMYMAFLGKTNFKDRNDPKNKELFGKLLTEVNEIKEQLEKYPENY